MCSRGTQGADLKWQQHGVSQQETTVEVRTVNELQSRAMAETEEVSVKPIGHANTNTNVHTVTNTDTNVNTCAQINILLCNVICYHRLTGS